MTEKVYGPASYFPSIEKKYGHPVAYWFDLSERSVTSNTWKKSITSKRPTPWAMAMQTQLSVTSKPKTKQNKMQGGAC